MLRTLIVDDEKLVRSEIKKLVNWSDFGISIVGEAENGKIALQFLADNKVDFMISDLTMPGLSGIEFLTEVKKLYPSLKIVVMTMHQEFELVQQAMRLGIVDYIAKTQLEKDKFSDILTGILKRLAQTSGEECCDAHEVVVLKRINNEDAIASSFAPCGTWASLDKDVFLVKQKHLTPPAGFLALNFSNTFGVPFKQILTRVNECFNTKLFYIFNENNLEYSFSINSDEPIIHRRRDEVATLFKGMEWLLNDSKYNDAVNEIPALCMTRDELVVFLYQPYLTCASYLRLEPVEYFNQTATFIWWYMWKNWLDELRAKTSLCLWPEDSPSFAMHKVISFVERHYAEEISLPQILELARMGKSTFSACFKEKTGKTFVNYLKAIRIEKAKKLLLETDQSIVNIGELVGYPDERYFRKVFLECEGITPAQFRR